MSEGQLFFNRASEIGIEMDVGGCKAALLASKASYAVLGSYCQEFGWPTFQEPPPFRTLRYVGTWGTRCDNRQHSNTLTTVEHHLNVFITEYFLHLFEGICEEADEASPESSVEGLDSIVSWQSDDHQIE